MKIKKLLKIESNIYDNFYQIIYSFDNKFIKIYIKSLKQSHLIFY
jgi:predicted acetyltransferase